MKDVFNRIEMLCRVVIFGKPEGTYYISLNGQLIKKLFDDSDEWDSFRILKDKIFAVKEKF